MARDTINSRTVTPLSWVKKARRFLLYKNERCDDMIERFRRTGMLTECPEDPGVNFEMYAPREFERLQIPYDRVTLRTRPYWKMAILPYTIYRAKCCQVMVSVADDEVYNEYLKVICHMIDAGVEVVDELPLRYKRSLIEG